ncbi:MAG: hypothetical protein ABII88_00780 [Candidatus Omnitrophota bacterium]
MIKAAFFVKICLIACSIVFIVAAYQKDKLPGTDEILSSLYNSPNQTQTDAVPFEVIKNNITYTITPLYNYELYGLVVSYFHTATWWNIYHKNWKDFINKKDLCLIWADNITNKSYQKMKFSSTSFECHYSTKDLQAWRNFRGNCLSNNHLLSADESIGEKIMDVGKGDQIYLKGYLVKYSHSGNTFERGSSTTRNDSGSGACETIFVKEFKVIKAVNKQWRSIHLYAKYAIMFLIILVIILWFKKPLYED